MGTKIQTRMHTQHVRTLMVLLGTHIGALYQQGKSGICTSLNEVLRIGCHFMLDMLLVKQTSS